MRHSIFATLLALQACTWLLGTSAHLPSGIEPGPSRPPERLALPANAWDKLFQDDFPCSWLTQDMLETLFGPGQLRSSSEMAGGERHCRVVWATYEGVKNDHSFQVSALAEANTAIVARELAEREEQYQSLGGAFMQKVDLGYGDAVRAYYRPQRTEFMVFLLPDRYIRFSMGDMIKASREERAIKQRRAERLTRLILKSAQE